jgi:hypothetical protein
MDACGAAVPGTRITRQREEIVLPDLTGPAFLDARSIEDYFSAARLRAPAGMGTFTWMTWETGVQR